MLHFPVRPEPEYLEDLGRIPEWGETAAMSLQSAWDEIDRLRREVDGLIEYDAETRAELAITALDDAFDPHGHFVYVLYGSGGEIVYVGRSANVLGRLGDHMQNAKRRHVHRVALIRCADYAGAVRLEAEMIQGHQPLLNILGIARVS